jgi:alginate O-acetyltransferase complex protein AlgJ
MSLHASIRTVTDLSLAAIFLAVVLLPPLVMLDGSEPATTLTEKRAPVELPSLTFDVDGLRTFPRSFEAYWNDAFAFRPTLVRSYNALALWLGVSPSAKVVIGKAGWLFVGDDYHGVESYRATRPFTPEQLELWRRALEAQQAWLAERGIHHLFVVAPDKSTIYPEYMPAALNRVGHATRLEQLLAYLNQRSDITVVDLRGALLAAKAHDRVYERTDSHWNDLGAWVADREISKRIGLWFPQVKPLPLSSFELRRLTRANDLALLLSLGDLLPADRLTFVPRVPRRARWHRPEGSAPSGYGSMLISEIDDSDLPRAVMFHDSFGEVLRPFFSEHFARVLYSWNVFDPMLIEQETPTVVVHEIVERVLMEDFPLDHEEVAGGGR